MECQIKCDCGRKIRLKKKNHSKLNEDIAPIGTNGIIEYRCWSPSVLIIFSLVSAKRSCAAAGIITHIDTSKTVWFQKLSETDRLRWTQSQLQKSFHKLANFGQPQIGFKAAVKINEVPYRVEVVEVNEDEGKVEVRMIDFGQIEQVNCTQLKMLPNQLARTKNLAHKGRLPDYCDINQLERSRFHRGLAVLPILSRLFQMCKREKLHPKLIWECKELTTQVRSASFSLLEPVGQIGSYPSAQVLQIFSPDKFYARFVKDYKKLRELQTQLESEYRQARPIANVDVSRLKLFVVLRSVDHKFYRAKLLEKASDTSAKVINSKAHQ